MTFPLLLVLAAAAAAPEPTPLLQNREETLANGLRVVVHSMPETDRVALRLLFPTGAAMDPAGRSGLAHLVEHVAYEGSAHAPGNAYDRLLAAVGGTNEGWTSLDYLALASTVPAGALSLSLFLESDRMGWLTPTPEALANQRAVVERERAEWGHTPLKREVLARALWPEAHPYRRTALGVPRELADVSLDEVRAFAVEALRPDGALLVVVGPQSADVLLAEARRWFADVPERGAPRATQAASVGAVPVPPAARTRAEWARDRARAPVRVWVDDDVYPAHVRIGWRTVPSGHPDEAALDLTMGLLRDRLDDDAVSAVHRASRFGGAFTVEIDATRPARTLRRVERALARLAWEGPSERELVAIRARWRTYELRDVGSADGRADALAECVSRGAPADCLPAVWAARDAVTPETIRAVTQRWLRPAERVLVGLAPRRAPLPRMYRVDKP